MFALVGTEALRKSVLWRNSWPLSLALVSLIVSLFTLLCSSYIRALFPKPQSTLETNCLHFQRMKVPSVNGEALWSSQVDKSGITGIHCTDFYGVSLYR
ncbi:hypothetical protein K443DRAFT_476333 [Laccaria amethystina LaAM-08-1]|uniref:Uncharacterized protein n=1 Tax=Laccaria amethystina LaAM-08-1 TaxID=1095629 RepID=A0A0C9WVE5_9AGAR|nr:hypothetical protein K443DRAFT_476333 [Laccaria amethystina LaAM-08-1]